MTKNFSPSSRPRFTNDNPLAHQFDQSLSPSMMRLGLNQITTYRWSMAEDVAACADLGIQNLGIWWPKLIRFGEERGIELLRDAGLHISSLSYVGGFTGSFGFRFKEAIAETNSAIHLARELQADCVTLLSGGKEKYTNKHAARLLRSGLKRVLETAEECQVTVALKPTHPSIQRNWSFLTSIDAAMEEIEYFDNPHLKLAIDVSQIEDVAQVLNRADELVPHIGIVKLSDASFPLRCQYERQQLGDGSIPLTEIVQTLEKAGYRGCYEIALWSRSLWENGDIGMLSDSIHRFHSLCRR